MKHVIIIETTDDPKVTIDQATQRIMTRVLEIALEDQGTPCAVYGRFNVSSAIVAVKEIYGTLEVGGTQ